MAVEHIQAVLTDAGFTQEDITALQGLPADAKDFKASDYVAKLLPGFETKIKNDPKFWEAFDENNLNEATKKKISDAQFGRAAGIAKQKVQKILGLSDADIADLTDEEKGKYEVTIAKYAEKYASTKAGDKQLQQDLINARKKLEESEASIPEKESALKTLYETKYNDEKIDFIVMAELATIDGLKTPAKYIAAEIAAELKGEYALELKGMKANLKQKEKPTLDVVEGTKILTLKDALTKILIRENLVEEKKTGKEPITGKTKIDVEGNNGELKVSSHIQKKIEEANK